MSQQYSAQSFDFLLIFIDSKTFFWQKAWRLATCTLTKILNSIQDSNLFSNQDPEMQEPVYLETLESTFVLILSNFIWFISHTYFSLLYFRSFHPDFLLVRQNVKDASEDYRNLLLGFQYGGIPSINSLQSIYNFQVGTIILKVYALYSVK